MRANSSKKILIVEDDEAIMLSLIELLKISGFDVSYAYNGQEALELLRSSESLPSLILLDLFMPVMDGFQFREEQIKDPKLKEIPVVVMSADGQANKKLKNTAVQDYLKKPARIEAILDTVNRYCS
jgi:CheY-like chemotaxis protein